MSETTKKSTADEILATCYNTSEWIKSLHGCDSNVLRALHHALDGLRLAAAIADQADYRKLLRVAKPRGYDGAPIGDND